MFPSEGNCDDQSRANFFLLSSLFSNVSLTRDPPRFDEVDPSHLKQLISFVEPQSILAVFIATFYPIAAHRVFTDELVRSTAFWGVGASYYERTAIK